MIFYFVLYSCWSCPTKIHGYSSPENAVIQWSPLFDCFNRWLSLDKIRAKDFVALFDGPVKVYSCTCDTKDITKFGNFFVLNDITILGFVEYDQNLDLLADLDLVNNDVLLC